MKKQSPFKKAFLAAVLSGGVALSAVAQQSLTGPELDQTATEEVSIAPVPDKPLPPPPVMSLDQHEKSDLLKLYPNPNQGLFTVEMESLGGQKITVFDLVGRLVFEKNVSRFDKRIEVDIQELNPGLYFLKVDRKVVRFKKL